MRIALFLAAAGLAIPASSPAAAHSFLDQLGRQIGNAAAKTIPGGSPQDGVSAAGFEHYGDWQIKLERLERGSDDAWQVIIAVRNSAPYRQGLVASSVRLFLISDDGEALPNWGELYKASVTGSAAGLEPVSGTMWLEPGDGARVRLRFDGSRRFKPARLRIQSTGAQPEVRTFPVGG
ncbi:hypothetical protein [Novosphingobium sp.]|uniref:hypothetical protein n=1 Tax=Novosphingobium sp. TaxID=1874826 RepID=UPI0026177AC9|nr:hypothetical protein [Novosphingobium sp.]